MLAAALVLFGVALGAAMLADVNPPVMTLAAFAALITGETLAVLALFDDVRAARARRRVRRAAAVERERGDVVEVLDDGPLRADRLSARLTLPAAIAVGPGRPTPHPRPRPVEDALDEPADPYDLDDLDEPVPGRHRAHRG